MGTTSADSNTRCGVGRVFFPAVSRGEAASSSRHKVVKITVQFQRQDTNVVTVRSPEAFSNTRNIATLLNGAHRMAMDRNKHFAQGDGRIVVIMHDDILEPIQGVSYELATIIASSLARYQKLHNPNRRIVATGSSNNSYDVERVDNVRLKLEFILSNDVIEGQALGSEDLIVLPKANEDDDGVAELIASAKGKGIEVRSIATLDELDDLFFPLEDASVPRNDDQSEASRSPASPAEVVSSVLDQRPERPQLGVGKKVTGAAAVLTVAVVGIWFSLAGWSGAPFYPGSLSGEEPVWLPARLKDLDTIAAMYQADPSARNADSVLKAEAALSGYGRERMAAVTAAAVDAARQRLAAVKSALSGTQQHPPAMVADCVAAARVAREDRDLLGNLAADERDRLNSAIAACAPKLAAACDGVALNKWTPGAPDAMAKGKELEVIADDGIAICREAAMLPDAPVRQLYQYGRALEAKYHQTCAAPDRVAATGVYQEARRLGSPEASFSLGLLASTEDHDTERALAYLSEAHRGHYVPAAYYMAFNMSCPPGQGFPQQRIAALFSEAAAAGFKPVYNKDDTILEKIMARVRADAWPYVHCEKISAYCPEDAKTPTR